MLCFVGLIQSNCAVCPNRCLILGVRCALWEMNEMVRQIFDVNLFMACWPFNTLGCPVVLSPVLLHTIWFHAKLALPHYTKYDNSLQILIIVYRISSRFSTWRNKIFMLSIEAN